jgi:metal-responsive CopG/Arc/MetJ family transcriptional regulator
MIRTQMQLTEEQFETLKELANERNVSVSELIRQAANELIASAKGIPLSERRKRAIAIAGRFRSGSPGEEVSSEHDAYLAEAYSS